MFRPIVFGALVAIAFLAAPGTPAFAGTFGSGHTSGDSVTAEVQSNGSTTTGSGGGTPQTDQVCTSKAINTRMEGLFRTDDSGRLTSLFDDEHREDQGAWYRQTCTTRTTIVSQRMFWVANADPTALAKQALDSALLPAPVIPMTPTPPAITYVNMPMWLWIDPATWKPVTATASADGLTVNVTAQPINVVWDSGDPRVNPNQRTKTCIFPGKVFNPNFSSTLQQSDCTYTYVHTSGKQVGLTFPLTATMQWRATWTATNGTNGDLGIVGRSSTIPVKVGEIQALNVRPN